MSASDVSDDLQDAWRAVGDLQRRVSDLEECLAEMCECLALDRAGYEDGHSPALGRQALNLLQDLHRVIRGHSLGS